jgi:hypothetical protein
LIWSLKGDAGFGCAAVIVKVRVELDPWGIEFGAKPFAIEKVPPFAVRVAVAVPPVPLLALTLPVVLTYMMGVNEVWCNTRTAIEKVHDPLPAMVPPVKLTELPPPAAVIVAAPHEPVSPFGFCTKRPAGNVSLKATAVIGLVDGLLIVNVKVDVAPT